MQHTSRSEIPGYRASGRERLAHLAAFLDDVPAGMLTFTRWYGHGRGCAIGLAANECVWMQAQGLKLATVPGGRVAHPVYAGFSDWEAVAAYFEVSPDAAQDLFTARGYGGVLRPDPRDVAARIRAFAGIGPEIAVA